MTAPCLNLRLVISTEEFEAMRFDGTKERADQIIAWVRAAHGNAIAPGHFRDQVGTIPAAVFQPLLGGTVMSALAGNYVVRRDRHYFAAYAPEVFNKKFRVLP